MQQKRNTQSPAAPAGQPLASGSPAMALKPWVAPAIEELAPLTDLTLVTPIGGGGDTGNGGSVVF